MKTGIRWIMALRDRKGVVEWGAYTSLGSAISELIRLRDGHGWHVEFRPKKFRCQIGRSDVYPIEEIM